MATDSSTVPHIAPAPDAHGGEAHRHLTSYYVYEAPVRLWHWLTAILVFGLSVTGYLIAVPPVSAEGDTNDLFRMGTIRELHFIAAYLLAIGMAWRGYWAIVHGQHARQIYYVPFWSLEWWKEVWGMVRWYLFLAKKHERWVGHNPLARASMFGMFTLGSTFMVLTGFGLYAEQAGLGSWQDTLFGWTLSLFGSSMALRTWHHVGMYLLLLFSAAHIYAAVRDDIMGRVSTISSMISGWRTFRD
ncbi:MAG: Ni/Fe-hydrogenase, b-type cytochrome subunit [Myxococcaceae bacterium]|nr:Ni/Fe-hydrogenase, b-type cytochrome subunit [Myxococcaceae bacterium]